MAERSPARYVRVISNSSLGAGASNCNFAEVLISGIKYYYNNVVNN